MNMDFYKDYIRFGLNVAYYRKLRLFVHSCGLKMASSLTAART